MRKVVVRILRFLIKIGILGRSIGFKYQGESLSLNKFYSQGHWSERNKIKKEFAEKFNLLLTKAKGSFFEKYYIVIFFNNRLDVDNIVGMEKVFTDCMKGVYVHNDSKQYFKGLMIFYDPFLPKQTTEFIVIEAKKDDYKDDQKRTRIRHNSKGNKREAV
jgi:hypothetical protein